MRHRCATLAESVCVLFCFFVRRPWLDGMQLTFFRRINIFSQQAAGRVRRHIHARSLTHSLTHMYKLISGRWRRSWRILSSITLIVPSRCVAINKQIDGERYDANTRDSVCSRRLRLLFFHSDWKSTESHGFRLSIKAHGARWRKRECFDAKLELGGGNSP